MSAVAEEPSLSKIIADLQKHAAGDEAAQQAISDLQGRLAAAVADDAADDATIAGLRSEVASLRAQIPDPRVLPGWDFVHGDEFSGTDLDRTVWNERSYIKTPTQPAWGLNFDAGRPEQGMTTVKDGIAHLRGEWRDAPYSRKTSSTGVTQITHRTAYLDQRKRFPGDVGFEIPFGLWVCKFKAASGPNTLGALNAFWIVDTHGRETDAAEVHGYAEGRMPSGFKYLQDTGVTTLFSDTNTGAGKVFKRWRGSGKNGAAARDDLGVDARLGKPIVPWQDFVEVGWALLPDKGWLQINGTKVWEFTPQTLPVAWGPDPANRPQHVRLNLHVGPDPKSWGLPDPANRALTKALDMQVDYLRIYTPAAA